MLNQVDDRFIAFHLFHLCDQRHQITHTPQFVWIVVRKVDQQVIERWPIERNNTRGFRNQGTETQRRIPPTGTVVQHNRQDRGQQAAWRNHFFPDEILINEPSIRHDANGHEMIDTALEFNEQVQIDPAPLHTHTPQDIVIAYTQIIGDQAVILALKC